MTVLPIDVVVPTLGRPSLGVLLRALADGDGPVPRTVLLVDDRRERSGPLVDAVPDRLHVQVLRGRGHGPAAARNLGWRAAGSDWVAFLDDDVVPPPGWAAALLDDLRGLPGDVAASQGRIEVPLPAGRRPTDWERNVAGLEAARWATADMAYRRAVLAELGGFDARFPRAYREDADLGLRTVRAGWRIVTGRRLVEHPPRPAGRWVSVRLQQGNADDVLMRALHGAGWRHDAGVPRGRCPRHVAVTATGLLAVAAAVAGRRRLAVAAGAAWATGTAEFAWARVAPGPRERAEVTTLLATSPVVPAAATWHWLRGLATVRGRLRDPMLAPHPARTPLPRAVLFDRDGTLVRDVPYNGDPARVELAPGAQEAVDRLRRNGVAVGVVTNQSGVARGVLTREQVDAVNARVAELLGGVDVWAVCPHGPADGCGCRKPAPGLVKLAAETLGVDPSECAVVGDIGADVQAALAAGARAVLVPDAATRPEEVVAAPAVALDLPGALDLLLGARR